MSDAGGAGGPGAGDDRDPEVTGHEPARDETDRDEPGWDEPEREEQEMLAGFRRTPGGVSARFSAAQAGIVRTLVGQVADLIGGDEAAPPQPGLWPGVPAEPGSRRGDEAEPGEEAGTEPFGMEELAAMLGSGGPTVPPEDPVLARLFPDAYRDDPEAAGEFRQYTEQGLRSGKMAAARTVLATLPGKGGRVRLSPEDAHVWLGALNDVRLALGVRLGIAEDYEDQVAGMDSTDPRRAYFQVYDWLTFLQETLVRALW